MDNKSLSAGLEDYIEAIYIAEIENKTIKGAELARILNISRASVSEALAKLVSKELIHYESYGKITLTPKGIQEAKKVYRSHNILKTFFEVVLGISSDEAGENACKIEHIISDNILEKISNFTQYCTDTPKVIEDYKLHNEI